MLPVRRSYVEYGLNMDDDIILQDLNCMGEEGNLYSCPIANSKSSNCDHTEDAGVKCGGEGYIETKTPLNDYDGIPNYNSYVRGL